MAAIVLIALYFLPTFIAACNRHRSTLAIVLVNIFLGWTVVGWFVALIWSIVAPAPVAPPIVIYNNSGSGTQRTSEPWQPYQVEQPFPVRQLADRVHEAMIPPAIQPVGIINFKTQEVWEKMRADEKRQWGSFEKYYQYVNAQTKRSLR
jgi:Superinfection immunity protein